MREVPGCERKEKKKIKKRNRQERGKKERNGRVDSHLLPRSLHQRKEFLSVPEEAPS